MLDLSQETEALARRLAAAQRVSIDEAIRQALEERARSAGVALVPEQEKPRGRSPEDIAARRASLERFAAGIAALPVLDPRSVEEIVGDINAL
jgi:antitoxin VapB